MEYFKQTNQNKNLGHLMGEVPSQTQDKVLDKILLMLSYLISIIFLVYILLDPHQSRLQNYLFYQNYHYKVNILANNYINLTLNKFFEFLFSNASSWSFFSFKGYVN